MKIIDFKTREAWLEGRKRYLTASNIAAALGHSPFCSGFKLHMQMRGELPADDLSDNELVFWGNKLEQPIREGFAELTERCVEPWQQTAIVVHDKHDWLACTPDAFQLDIKGKHYGTLQIKNTGTFPGRNWKDEPPLHVQIQCQLEAYICGLQVGTACALVGGNKLVWHDFEVNQRFIDAAIPKLEEFMRMVRDGVPPEPDGSESTREVLKALYPEDSGETIIFDELDPIATWADEVEGLRSVISNAEKEKRLYENKIRAAMRDASYGQLADGRRVSLTTTKHPEKHIKACSFRVLRVSKSKENNDGD